MRFDLELNMVNRLTNDGLQNMSVMLYPNTDTPFDYNKTIDPMKWDTKVLSFYENNGNINTSNFKDLSRVADKFITSGITNSSTINLETIIDHDANKSLVFNGGDYYSHNDKISWSINTIYAPMEYKNNFYQYKLDDDFDIDSVDIFTISLKYPGYFKKNKRFIFKKYDGISIESTFKKSLESYIYTIHESIVYLNIKQIQYTNKIIGKVKEGNRIFALPEFPYKNMIVENLEIDDFFVKSGVLVIKKETTREILIGEDVVIACDIQPMISFKQIARSEERPDMIIDAVNVGQRSIGFNNGTICLYTSYNNESFPIKITTKILDNDLVINYGDSAIVESIITGVDEIPLSKKEITLKINSTNAKFQENNSFEYSGITGIDGSVKATLNIGDIPIGTYIQREWVSNTIIDGQLKGQITLPFRHASIGTSDIFDKKEILNGFYLYKIQSNDPILGKEYASLYEEPLNEYYQTKSIDSYYINGRKIAHIELRELDNKIFSSYIKPENIEIENDLSSRFRNLFIKDINNGESILSIYADSQLISTDNTAVSSGKYTTGILPDDKMKVYENTFSDNTIITYSSPFPLSDPELSGFWLISDRNVEISSFYNDGDIELQSNITNIKIKSIEAETPFLLSGYSLPGFDTKVSNTGYLTISDYIKNPFGIRSCSYYCIYSDAINKKCIHKDIKFRKFFQLDTEKIGCIHTPEYDITIPEEKRCLGVYARTVDPFYSQSEL